MPGSEGLKLRRTRSALNDLTEAQTYIVQQLKGWGVALAGPISGNFEVEMLQIGQRNALLDP
jgi:hypothetical protein